MLGRLVLYLPVGYPDWDMFFRALDAFEAHGVGYVELGIPSSNPFVDGGTIRACHERVFSEVTFDNLAEALRKVRKRYSFKVILMTYAADLERLRLRELDISLYDALLCVDAKPRPEEHPGLVHVFTPDMDDGELDDLLGESSLFAYAASGQETGGELGSSDAIRQLVGRIHARADLPAFVGFGIRGPEDVRRVLALGADGAIIGSELIRQLDYGGVGAVDVFLESIEKAFSA